MGRKPGSGGVPFRYGGYLDYNPVWLEGCKLGAFPHHSVGTA